MVPKLAGQGSSFKGATDYYLHDKNADTAHRVEFTYTRNLPTDDPEMAWRWMAKTAMDSERLKAESGADLRGAKSEKPVFTLSLSWHPDEEPEHEHMIDAMQSALDALGLHEHQTLMVAHNDEPQKHIHAIVSLVHPVTGKTPRLKNSKERLSEWAQAYEEEHGIYCEQRIENNAKRQAEKDKRQQAREQGSEQEKPRFPRNKEKEAQRKAEITGLYFAAESGQEFVAGLAELGFTVAQGRRLVLVENATGKQYSLYRQIDGAKPAAIKKRLSDVEIPSVDDARARQAEKDFYFDRDAQEREQDERIIDAGISDSANRRRRAPSPAVSPFTLLPPRGPAREQRAVQTINRLQDVQHGEWGHFYEHSHRQRADVETLIEKTYGRNAQALRQSIQRRERAIRDGGWVSRWYLKNFTAERERLQEDLRSLASIEERSSEMREAVESQLARERYELEKRFEGQRRSFETSAPSRTPAHAHPAPTFGESAAMEVALPDGPRLQAAWSAAADPLVTTLSALHAAASAGGRPPDSVSVSSQGDYGAERVAHMDRASAAQQSLEAEPGPTPGEGKG